MTSETHAEDYAYALGFDLARDGVDALLRAGYTTAEHLSFLTGMRDGSRQLDADREATERLEHATTEACD